MHTGGHLRSAFLDWALDGFPEVVPAEGPDHYFYDGQDRSAQWLIGQLWHCSDIIPGYLCEEIGLPRGSTYAQAVQGIAPVYEQSRT